MTVKTVVMPSGGADEVVVASVGVGSSSGALIVDEMGTGMMTLEVGVTGAVSGELALPDVSRRDGSMTKVEERRVLSSGPRDVFSLTLLDASSLWILCVLVDLCVLECEATYIPLAHFIGPACAN